MTAKRHLEMAVNWKGEKLGVLETRRHYSNYFRGIHNFRPYRTKLVTTNSLQSLFNVFKEIELKKQEFEEAIV